MTINQIPIPGCHGLPEFPEPLELTLPGGVTLSQIISATKSVPNSIDMGLNLLQQAQPAMAPLIPIFDIIDTIATLVKVVQAIPKALGPPPSPQKLIELMPELNEKVQKLLKLLPQLSVPLMINGLIQVLIDILNGIHSQLLALDQQRISVMHAAKRAAELNDPDLASIALCAENNIEQQGRNLVDSLASLQNLFNLINLFMGMIGAPELPDFSSISGKPLSEVLTPLDALITSLKTIQKAIPLP